MLIFKLILKTISNFLWSSETVFIAKNESTQTLYALRSLTDEKTPIITATVVKSDNQNMTTGHYKLTRESQLPLITGDTSYRREQNNSAAILNRVDEKIKGYKYTNVTIPFMVGGVVILVTLVSKVMFDKWARYKRVLNEESQRSRSSVGSNSSEGKFKFNYLCN